MGCYFSRRPHVNANNAEDLQKILDQEQIYLQSITNQKDSNVNLNETLNLNYTTRLYMLKSSLIQLEHKIEKNKDKINEKQHDWRMIYEILDKYYELKENNFFEKNDDNFSDIDESMYKINSPSKVFIKEIDEYLGS